MVVVLSGSGSFAKFRVNDDGDRSVVDQVNGHIGAEPARLHGSAQVRRQLLEKRFVERNRDFGRCGTAVGGAISLFGAGKKRELTDDEDLTGDIGDRSIHHALIIIEDS